MDQMKQCWEFMKSALFLEASQGPLLNWLSPMHELSPPPGRTEADKTYTHTRGTSHASLIILSMPLKWRVQGEQGERPDPCDVLRIKNK